MPITEFPIATTQVEDLIPTKLPHPGSVSHNVAQLATAGAGTYASPWTGWDTEVEALLVASKLARTFHFPSGVYGYSVSPNFGRRSHTQLIGEHGTIMKYSGTGVAMNFLAEELDIGGAVTNFGIVCKNFLIDGTASGTYGLYLGSIHHSLFEQIAVRGDFDVGIKLEFTICNTYNMLRVTSRVGDSGNDDDAGTMPAIGIYADTGAIVGAGAFQTVQACTFIDPVVEILPGGSVPSGGTAASYFGAGFHQNVIIGGTFEQNSTRNLVIGGNGNTFICTDNEYPGDTEATDFLVWGDDNQFINCLSLGNIIIGESVTGNTATNNRIIGGQFGGIKINPQADKTVIDGPGYNFTNALGFYDGSYTTEYGGVPRDLTSTDTKGWGLKTAHDVLFRGGALFSESGAGPTLTAPDGGLWRLTVDNAGALTTTAGTAPAMHAQSDNFNDNSLGKQWVVGTISATIPSSVVTVAETGNQLSITLPNSTAGNSFAGIKSISHKLNDTGYERINLISKPTTGLASYQVRFSMGWGTSASSLMFVLENTTLYVYDGGANVANVAFVLANMDFWRFNRSGTDILCQYSADGSSWTTLYTSSTPHPWGLVTEPYIVCIEAGSTASTTFDAPVILDNYLYFKG